MGWLWSSGAASAAPSQAASSSNTEVTSANTPTSQASPSQAPPAPQADSVDLELAKFFAQIQAEFSSDSNNRNSAQQSKSTSSDQASSASPPPTPSTTAAPTKSSSSSWNFFSSTSTASSPTAPTQIDTTTTSPPHNPSYAQGEQQPDRLDPVSESLLPTTMSCRQAFDTAFHCNSLGGQWTSVYRAGTVRSCSEHWDNFWFCMRTRAYTGETKDEAIRDYYRQRELAKYYGPGKPKSTDVWEAREEKVAPGTAFQKKYEMPEISDEEWWQMEIEHRRKVQEDLQRKEAAAQR